MAAVPAFLSATTPTTHTPAPRHRPRRCPRHRLVSCASHPQPLATAAAADASPHGGVVGAPAPPPPHALHTREQQLHFLRTVWGKRPMLIRNFLPQCERLLSRDDVFALASRASCPSRLIETHRHDNEDDHDDRSSSSGGGGGGGGGGSGGDDGPPFSLSLGPFEPAELAQLPPHDWTVLVQGVDRHVPAVADLLDAAVPFLPNWRLDDVQLSYATRGGGVGAHVDNFDVFLVQGRGRRRWRVAAAPVPPAAEEVVDDCDVRVLRHGLRADGGDWILEPGDALYLPPRFPHHGVCVSPDCTTFSIGFRAPTAAALLAAWAEHAIDRHALHDQYLADDPHDLAQLAGDRGRVSSAAANRAYDTLRAALLSDHPDARRSFVDWFVAEVSQQKVALDDDYDDFDDDDDGADDGQAAFGEKEIDALLAAARADPAADRERRVLRQREGAVFTYFEHDSVHVTLYVDGQKFDVEHVDVATAVCNHRQITLFQYARVVDKFPSADALFRQLLMDGSLYVKCVAETIE